MLPPPPPPPPPPPHKVFARPFGVERSLSRLNRPSLRGNSSQNGGRGRGEAGERREDRRAHLRGRGADIRLDASHLGWLPSARVRSVSKLFGPQFALRTHRARSVGAQPFSPVIPDKLAGTATQREIVSSASASPRPSADVSERRLVPCPFFSSSHPCSSS